MKFVKLTENNDNEGESWNFWLQLDGNEDGLKELQTWLNTFDDNGEEYELNLTPVDESEVDTLVKHSGSGYMNYENKVVGTFKLPAITDKSEENGYEWLNDNFYKGGIRNCFSQTRPKGQ